METQTIKLQNSTDIEIGQYPVVDELQETTKVTKENKIQIENLQTQVADLNTKLEIATTREKVDYEELKDEIEHNKYRIMKLKDEIIFLKVMLVLIPIATVVGLLLSSIIGK